MKNSKSSARLLNDERKIEAVEKTLGEPVASDFSEYVRKIRNNLIIISFIAISICLYDLTLAEEATFLGLKFNGLDHHHIFNIIFFLNCYFWLHFLWCSFDHFHEWQLRVTGTRLAFITGSTFEAEEKDYHFDPRQSTLHNWWSGEAKKIGSLSEPIDIINKKLVDFKSEFEAKTQDLDATNIKVYTHDFNSSIKQVSSKIQSLLQSIEKHKETISSDRIPVSLERFDQWTSIFLRSQNLRWLVIELLFPLIIGLCSIFLLWEKI